MMDHTTEGEIPPAKEGRQERESRRGLAFGRRIVVIAAVSLPVLALLAILAWASITSGPARGGLAVNDSFIELNVEAEIAPDFAVPQMGGGEISVAALRGRVVMVDFWASWCPPCRDEAPVLAQVYAEYNDKGVEFVGVNLWDNAGDAGVFLQQEGHRYPNGIDEEGKIAISYGVRGIPEKFFINRDGLIVRKFSGPMDADRLRGILDTVLLE